MRFSYLKKTVFNYVFAILVLSVFVIAMPSLANAEEADATEVAQEDIHTVVNMKPIVVPLLARDGDPQIVTLIIAIEVPDRSTEQLVMDQRIRLADAYLTDMYGALDNRRIVKNGFINVRLLKSRLNKITKKVLGEEIASNIMIKAIQQRKV